MRERDGNPKTNSTNDTIMLSILDVIEKGREENAKSIEVDMSTVDTCYGGGWRMKVEY